MAVITLLKKYFKNTYLLKLRARVLLAEILLVKSF